VKRLSIFSLALQSATFFLVLYFLVAQKKTTKPNKINKDFKNIDFANKYKFYKIHLTFTLTLLSYHIDSQYNMLKFSMSNLFSSLCISY